MFGMKKNEKIETDEMQGSSEDISAETSPSDREISDEVKVRSQVTKFMAARLGEIVGLLMRAPTHQNMSFKDLEWLALPPLMNNQLSIAYTRDPDSGINVPVGVVLWAEISEEVEQKHFDDLNKPFRFEPSDWRSGDRLWIVDAIGNPKVIQEHIVNLTQTVFKGKSVKMRAVDNDGKRCIRTIQSK